MDRAGTAGLIMMVGGILGFIGLFLPWYGVYAEGNTGFGTYIIQGEYSWNEVRYYTSGFGQSSITIKTYGQANLYRTGEVMGAGHSLVALGALMLGVAGLVGLAGGRGASLSPQALGIVGLLGMLIVIAGVGYVAAMLPGAQLQDAGGCQAPAPCSSFIGSDSGSNSREAWGPGIGWVLAIPAAVVGLVGSLQMRSVPRGVSPAAMFNPQAAGGGYGGPAPGYGYGDPQYQPYGQPVAYKWPPEQGGPPGG